MSRKATWAVKDYPLQGKPKKGGRSAAVWTAIPLSIFSVLVGSGRGIGRALGRVAVGLGNPWTFIILGVVSLLLTGAIFSCVRKGYPLSAIPIGLIALAGLLVAASMYVHFLVGKTPLSMGFVIAGVISFALMPFSAVAVNLYYRKRGTLPERNEYPPAFMIGVLIFLLLAVAFCVVMIVIF